MSTSTELIVTGIKDENETSDYVTMMVCDQLFGVPVLQVHDVLSQQRITPIPLAPREIVGSLNLRGRIVTVIDLRRKLGLEERAPDQKNMTIVVQHEGELYSLVVDQVGEVMSLPALAYEKNPATMPEQWRSVAQGIFRLDDRLLIALDTANLLRIDAQTENS